MNANAYLGAPQGRDRQGIVNFSGCDVVDRVRFDVSQGQVQVKRGKVGLLEREPPGEVGCKKTVAMQLQGVGPGPNLQQQFFRGGGQLRYGGVKGFPFKRVLVGLDQEGLDDVFQPFGQRARYQFIGPVLLLFGRQPFFLDGSQGRLQNFRGGRAIAAFATSMKICRCTVQGEDQGGLFDS